MSAIRRAPPLGTMAYFGLTLAACAYFAFAAVQGENGLFRRIEIEAETAALEVELARLKAETAALENLTRRLSDSSLDLDLLDERAREVLGMVRADEIVIR